MIKPHWQQIIEQEKLQDYYCQLQGDIIEQRAQGITIFPEESDVFNAFKFSDLADVKVVVLGQDPYHGVGKGDYCNQPQAHGLAFSVTTNIKTPPSLVNIYKELVTDIEGFITPTHGNLTSWAEQGVLLLNTVLTVQQGQAHSHAKLGWERFTDKIIAEINQHNDGCVFILWGAHAQKKGRSIDGSKHLVLNGPHPSPLSAYRGFFGCQHFSKANHWLVNQGKSAIDWRLNNSE
ncbi:MAG: uracil-DNA glycosylase [Colwellia sp.]|jgi:uracil-DNA glycosylase|tara:strand:- start:470 stop:1171 length:702 start_codon:yes stop_codon:yes gene_type:complete